MFKELFLNTSTLVKFTLRRERLNLFIWIICIALLSVAVAAAFPNLFSSEYERQHMAEMMQSPAMVAMLGPAYGADNYTSGAMMSNMMLLFTVIGVAIMNIFLVVKHTRRDEEEGRVEVVRSLPVGRISNLASTIIVSVIANWLITLVVGFGLASLRIESMDLHGSLLYGAVLGVSGMFFASITAIFAQLTSTSRGALGYSFTFLGLSYLIQAGGASQEILTYISPLGFVLKTQAYVSNYWWPLLVLKLVIFVILIIAFILNEVRDLGEGMIHAKPGRKNASIFLKGTFGLSVRLVRNIFIGWIIGLMLLGMSYGSVMGDLESFMSTNDFFQQMLDATQGPELVEQFVTMIISIMAIVATVPVLIVLLKVRSEEKKGRNEIVLSKKVSKTKLLGGYFALSIIGSVVMLFSVVFGLWVASYAAMQNADPITFIQIIKSGAVYLPAMWVMIGIAMMLIAYFPRRTSVIWGYLGLSFFLTYLLRIMAAYLNLPEWLPRITPFGNVPQIPTQEMNWTNIVVLTCIAAVTICVGFIQYKKRDFVS